MERLCTKGSGSRLWQLHLSVWEAPGMRLGRGKPHRTAQSGCMMPARRRRAGAAKWYLYRGSLEYPEIRILPQEATAGRKIAWTGQRGKFSTGAGWKLTEQAGSSEMASGRLNCAWAIGRRNAHRQGSEKYILKPNGEHAGSCKILFCELQ